MYYEQPETGHSQIIRFAKPAIDVTYFKSLDDAVNFAFGSYRYRGAFVAMNAEKFITLYLDQKLFAHVKNPIYYADGSAMLWFASKRTPRIPGVELWLRILKRAEQNSCKVLVIGATPNVSQVTYDMIADLAPDLTYCCIDGFQSENEYLQMLVETKPDVVFVAMGSPLQEILISRLQAQWPDSFYMGLGGSLDVLTGNVTRAPEIYRKCGVEFLYRLLKEPRRAFHQWRRLFFIYLFLSGKFSWSKL